MPVEVDGDRRMRWSRTQPPVVAALLAVAAGVLAGLALHPVAPPSPAAPAVHFVQTVRNRDALSVFDEPQDPIDDPTHGRRVDPTSRRLTDVGPGVLYGFKPAPDTVCARFVAPRNRTTWCLPGSAFRASGLTVRLPRTADDGPSTSVRWCPDGRLEWWDVPVVLGRRSSRVSG